MTFGRRARRGAAAAALVALVFVVPRIVGAQDADGFDGFIQSGTCAAPTDDMRANLTSDGDHDIEPYLARTGNGDETVTLGYYGAPGVPGFGFSTIYTDFPFSLVITDSGGSRVACGDLLQPDADKFAEAGVALVQLLPVGDSAVQGVAAIDRAPLQRELVITPTRVRVLLTSGGEVTTAPEPAAGFDGFIQGGTCESPGNRVRVQLRGRGDHDVEPFLAQTRGSGEPVTVAYYGTSGAPGFGLAAAYTSQSFSLVVTDTETAAPVACGDILEPDDDDFVAAGMALVQLSPVGDAGAQGFAVIERIPLQRELDVTPTRVRIVLFAPPITAS